MTQELRKLAEAATQGKWSQTPPSGIYRGRMIVTDDRAACIGETHNANATENAAFIAAANPAEILDLLDRLEKAEKAMEQQKDEWLSWQAKREQLEQDAARYRWLTADHDTTEMRERAEDAGIRLRWIGKGASDATIDTAMEASK